ncbi:hypothetical protein [Virgibacillus sp. CBA3643]
MAEKIALSFSGGKDSCLALYRLQEQNMEVLPGYNGMEREAENNCT